MNDVEFQKLLNAEPPVILKASKAFTYIIMVLLACVIAVFIMIQMPFITGLGYIILIIIIGGLACFLSMSAALVLNQQNFTSKSFKEERSYLWKDVANFSIKSAHSRYGRSIYLTFDYLPEKRPCQIPLVDSNLDFEQFVKLMNHWRERALQQNG